MKGTPHGARIGHTMMSGIAVSVNEGAVLFNFNS